MNFDKDTIVFEALRKVLRNKAYRRFGQALAECEKDLQRIFPSLSEEQRDIVQAYIHALTDVYTAALTVCTEESHPEFL